ncbi:MAG: hypothetical protein E7448_02525 [Ruminococcaceae bacterium]|nr:hypothetical protein [Oscillospiraceae bacterium]
MKKLTAFWNRIPRPLLVLLHIVVILLCILMIYIASASPSFTAEMQYRRLEKSHMIGPATILGTETVTGQDKILVAKTDTHLMLYFYTEGRKITSTDLLIRESHGDLTILPAAERLAMYSERSYIALPVILFDEYPEAVRAEVEFTIFLGDYTDPQQTMPYEKHFFLESTRANDGYFRFTIEHESYSNHLYTKMLQKLANVSRGVNYDGEFIANTPISVRLYDQNDQMITDQIIYFHPLKEDPPNG